MPSPLPWLAAPEAKTEISPSSFLLRSFRHTGSLARYLTDYLTTQPAFLDSLAASLPQWNTPLWLSAVAREILLANLSPSTHSIPAIFQNSPLFPSSPHSPTLASFLAACPPSSSACTLLPLETVAAASASCAQLWVFPSHAAPALPTSHSFAHPDLLPHGWSAFALLPSPSHTRIEGKSWHLAAALALEAANASLAPSRIDLASRWIPTGELPSSTPLSPAAPISPVRFSQKPSLASAFPHHRWLLPAENQVSIPQDWEPEICGNLFFARDLRSAFNQISGEGFASSHPTTWTSFSPIEEFHCFASNAVGPMLAPFLWTSPTKIILWASEKMRPIAETLLAACTQNLPASATEIREVNDTDLPAIRSHLLSSSSFSSTRPSLFNITGGNLLMRVAILDIARLRPNLHLVYRPENELGTDFLCISHPVLRPVVARLTCPSLPNPETWETNLLNASFSLQANSPHPKRASFPLSSLSSIATSLLSLP